MWELARKISKKNEGTLTLSHITVHLKGNIIQIVRMKIPEMISQWIKWGHLESGSGLYKKYRNRENMLFNKYSRSNVNITVTI